jgi:glycosyltransferase involved in cell wall biosynthesis
MAHVLINVSYAPSLINFRGHLIARLVELGHHVTVTAPKITQAQSEQIRRLGAVDVTSPLKEAGLRSVGDLFYVFWLWRLVRKNKIDLVIGFTLQPNIWGSIAAKISGIRSVSVVTGLGRPFMPVSGLYARFLQKVAHKLYRLATSFNETVIFQNADDLRDFIDAGCLKEASRARIVDGSGVDTDYFAPAAIPEKTTFLFIGRLLKSKGVREYCEAAKILLQNNVEADFLLVGIPMSGADAVTQAEIENWRRSGIIMLGQLEDVRPAIAACTIYVLPSYREGTPRSVLEAMAMERPVITTDAPGCRDAVKQDENGILVPVGDPLSLAKAMTSLMEQPVICKKMGKIGREIALNKYNINKVTEQYIGNFGLS